MTYLFWLIIFMGVPFTGFLLLDHRIFITNWRIFAKTALGTVVFAYLWDFLSIKTGIWYFPRGLLGLYLLELPLEEYLFMIGSAAVITYTTLYLLKNYAKD